MCSDIAFLGLRSPCQQFSDRLFSLFAVGHTSDGYRFKIFQPRADSMHWRGLNEDNEAPR